MGSTMEGIRHGYGVHHGYGSNRGYMGSTIGNMVMISEVDQKEKGFRRRRRRNKVTYRPVSSTPEKNNLRSHSPTPSSGGRPGLEKLAPQVVNVEFNYSAQIDYLSLVTVRKRRERKERERAAEDFYRSFEFKDVFALFLSPISSLSLFLAPYRFHTPKYDVDDDAYAGFGLR